MFDVAKVRKDFPILEEQVYGKRLVYLDNGATTQRPLQVIEKMNEYYLKYNSNVHRGVHFLSNKCTDANEEAREIVRKFIHAGSDKEIIFTRGTTESINLVAEVKELKANPHRRAKGAVIEARLDKGQGPVATILVQKGTLHQGDVVIAGTSVGRVRVMRDDQGAILKEAGPSMPVEITGLTEVPAAGDLFDAVEDEKLARELADRRAAEQKEQQFSAYKKVTLDNLFSQIAEGERKELAIIVKADVQGSAEAVKQSLEKISNDEVRVRVIHAGVGAINKSDVMLANAGNAIIIGFNVRPDPVAKEEAAQAEVELRMYRVIYDAINDVTDAMKGMLAPKFREVELGRAEVRSVFKISSAGTIAGCYVLEGKVTRAAKIRLVRDGIVITEDEIDSLRRFKDDVKEVAQGYECGIGLDKFSDIKEGDIFEAFIMEEYRD